MYLQKYSAIQGRRVAVLLLFCLLLFSISAFSEIQSSDVLILVNENSPTSRYIAKLYRQYHPSVPLSRVLNLSGLTDSSKTAPDGATAASEIITRTDYNNLIAQPVRDYLTSSGLVTQVKVIITTAGMPYRILDTSDDQQNFSNPSNAVYAGGSNPTKVSSQEAYIDASSVEAELTCLWYADYGSNGFLLRNRMVNPYQGYRNSGMNLFERMSPGTKTFNWSIALSDMGGVDNPFMEGIRIPFAAGTVNRSFHVGDMYLVCRLDGPKNQGKSAIFAVRSMLERAKRASNLNFGGVNPSQAVAVLDDAPTKYYDNNRTFNLDFDRDCWIYGQQYWDYDGIPSVPPDVPGYRVQDDYVQAYRQILSTDPTEGILNIGYSSTANDLCVMLDRRASKRTNQQDLEDNAAGNPLRDSYQGIVFLCTYGYNGDEPAADRVSSYLLTRGPGGGPLFKCVNGAVFTSIESLNAVTMFFDVQTLPAPHHQGKIVDFIEMGGSGAIGHCFEPQSDAAIDNEFLLYNLLSDEDDDGFADLTFIEAAYTAIPYLSWSEVVIGDPLMRIAYGNGGKVWTRLSGDANNDGCVDSTDIWCVKYCYGGMLNSSDPAKFNKYHDLCDVNKDSVIDSTDIWCVKYNYGLIADWR
jgi:hypothetical protein